MLSDIASVDLASLLAEQKLRANRLFAKWTADIQEEAAYTKIHPNINPVFWIVGHVTVADDWLNQALAGAQQNRLSHEFVREFAPGTQPVPRGPVTSWEQIQYNRQIVLALQDSLLKNLLSSDLCGETEVKPPALLPFVKTRLDALTAMTMHTNYHWGQIGVIRRGLGLPGFF